MDRSNITQEQSNQGHSPRTQLDNIEPISQNIQDLETVVHGPHSSSSLLGSRFRINMDLMNAGHRLQDPLYEATNYGTTGDGDSEDRMLGEEARLLLYVNNLCAPVGYLAPSPARTTQFESTHFDQNENTSHAMLLSELRKWKALHEQTIKQAEMLRRLDAEATVKYQMETAAKFKSLEDKHGEEIQTFKREQRRLERELYKSKRENSHLQFKSQGLQNEFDLLNSQYKAYLKRAEAGDNSTKSRVQQAKVLLDEMTSITMAQGHKEKTYGLLMKSYQNNEKLIAKLAEMRATHDSEVERLKHQLEAVGTQEEIRQNDFKTTLANLTTDLQSQLEYTQSLINYSHRREVELEENLAITTTYVRETVSNCRETIEELERQVELVQSEKNGYEQIIDEFKLTSTGQANDQAGEHSRPRNDVPASTISDEYASQDPKDLTVDVFLRNKQVWELEKRESELRVIHLQKRNDILSSRLQDFQQKYNKLNEKYSTFKTALENKVIEAKDQRYYITCLKHAVAPLFAHDLKRGSHEIGLTLDLFEQTLKEIHLISSSSPENLRSDQASTLLDTHKTP